jgi:hypothetical protein
MCTLPYIYCFLSSFYLPLYFHNFARDNYFTKKKYNLTPKYLICEITEKIYRKTLDPVLNKLVKKQNNCLIKVSDIAPLEDDQ